MYFPSAKKYIKRPFPANPLSPNIKRNFVFLKVGRSYLLHKLLNLAQGNENTELSRNRYIILTAPYLLSNFERTEHLRVEYKQTETNILSFSPNILFKLVS